MLTDGLSYRFVNGFGYFSAPLLTAPDALAHRCAQAEESFVDSQVAQRRSRVA